MPKALSSDIRTIEDLRARKKQLQEEVETSRQMLEQQLQDFNIEKGAVRKAVTGAALSWGTSYLFSFFGGDDSKAWALGARSDKAGFWGYLPLIRKGLKLALKFTERRRGRKKKKKKRH